MDCHGANGAGRTFVNDGKGTHIAGPNISLTIYSLDDPASVTPGLSFITAARPDW